MKKLLSVLVGLSLFLSLTGCKNGSDLDDIISSGKLIMATNAEFPPYEYLNDKTEIVGIDIEIAGEIAKAIGVELEIVNKTFDGARLEGQTGKANLVMAGLTVSDKRKETFDFTNTYAEANQKLIIKKGSSIQGSTVEEVEALLNGKTIGVQLGTVSQYYVEGSEDWGFAGIKGATCKSYESSLIAATLVKSGTLDALMVDSAPGAQILKKHDDLMMLDVLFTEESYAIATKKGNTALVNKVNEILAALKESGKLDEIFARHI